MRPTCIEIAENYNLWESNIDPCGTMTEEEFDALSTEEKLATIHQMFPEDCNCEEDED